MKYFYLPLPVRKTEENKHLRIWDYIESKKPKEEQDPNYYYED